MDPTYHTSLVCEWWKPVKLLNVWYTRHCLNTRHFSLVLGIAKCHPTIQFMAYLSSFSPVFWQWLKIWTPVLSFQILLPFLQQTIQCLVFRWVDSTNIKKFLLEAWARELSTWSREPLGPTDGGLAPEGTAAVSLKGWADSDLEEKWNKTGHDWFQGLHNWVSSPYEQSKQGGSKFNWKKKSAYPCVLCQRIVICLPICLFVCR